MGDGSEGLEGEGMDPEGHSGGVARAPSSRQGPGRNGLDDPGQGMNVEMENHNALQSAGSGSQPTAVQGHSSAARALDVHRLA